MTATGPSGGEVVQAGQMIVRLARKDGRDAVFGVPAQLIRSAPSDPQITVSLTDDPSVTASGRVREVAAQANPVTRTFEIKVGLTDPPAAMRLGATVIGRMQTDAVPIIEIPATALTRINQQPAVWIVDPSTKRFQCETSMCCALTRRRWLFPMGSIPAKSWSPREFRHFTRARRFVCLDQSHD